MSTWSKLRRSETTIDFVGLRRRWFTISAVIILLSIAGFVVRGGLNLGIEFEGGLALQTPNPAQATVPEVRDAMQELGIIGATIQELGDGESLRVTAGVLSPEVESEAVSVLANVAGVDRAEVSISAVGPSFGALVLQRSLVALGVFLGAVILYISWRLEFKMAMAGIVALIHDLVITAGVYAITGFEVTPATVVAILTILGYSLYDTVVVFDKIDELVIEDEKTPYRDIVNNGMNSVLGRSLATSITSLIPIGSILFVGAFLLGAPTLREFALALFVGIGVGTYSSIFVAAPILSTWKEGEDEWAERAARAEKRSRSARK
ncbi:MAG: protein translocase subunit SecF [Actinobacteria bacterium]|nr:MAG: protein translocase subunit SecF [Actinomycetota bacterium]